MTDLASMSMRIDSSDAVSAANNLDRLTAAARRTSASAHTLKDTWGQYAGTVGRGLSALSLVARAAPGVVSAATSLVKVFDSAQKEAFSLASAIEMTGNAAGTTRGQLQLYAEQIDDIVGTQAEAAAALSKFVSSAAVQADNLRDFATLAIQMQRTVGQSVGETVKLFEQLGTKPAAASAKLQRQFGFLTIEIYDQIRALEEQGRSTAAAQLAQQTFANAMRDRMAALEPQLGLIQKSWRGIKSAAKEAWDAMLDIGREQSADQLLAALEQRRGDRKLFSGTLRQDADDTREIALRRQIAAQQEAARAEAAAVATTNDYIKAQKEAEKAAKEREAAQKAAATTAKRLAEAQLSFDISAIQRNLTSTLSAFSNFEDLLEVQRRAGLISEREYYAEKRTLIEKNSAAQIAALEAESKRLKADRLVGPELLEQQRKIADNEAEIAIIRARAATQVEVNAKQQKAALDSVARAFEAATASAGEYLKALSQKYQMDLDSRGLGNRQRDVNADRGRIDDDFLAQRQQLDRDQATHPNEITASVYADRLEIIKDAHAKALAEHERYWSELQAKEGDFAVGASEAIRNFVDESKNIAAQTEQVFSRAFDGMADALTRFTMTGKLDFKSLADSIIADLIRIQMRAALSRIFSLIGSAIGGAGNGDVSATTAAELNAGFAGARAGGGAIEAGRAYLVGEKGPELVVPRNPGIVVPNHQIGGGVTIHQVNHFAAGVDQAAIAVHMQRLKEETKAEVYQSMGRNRWRRVTG